MDAQYFSFYIILSNYVLFYQNSEHNFRRIRFHVCIKMHRCKRRVCKRKTRFGQPNIIANSLDLFKCETVLILSCSNSFHEVEEYVQ